MARKLPVVLASGETLSLTPNQFMRYKMKERPAQLITRLGHFSLGVYGIHYPSVGKPEERRVAMAYAGKATDMAVQREYEDLGVSLESLQSLDEAGMKAYGKEWGAEHARDLLRRMGEYKRMLADMDGHPLEAELLADMAAVAAVCNEYLGKRRDALLSPR